MQAERTYQAACSVADEAGHICKREPGHPGVHEHYKHGKTISWPNASGWFVLDGRDDDGPYWYLSRGSDHDDRKFDTRAAAEAVCEITNRRGQP
jgi:ferredoxin-NADP reductase